MNFIPFQNLVTSLHFIMDICFAANSIWWQGLLLGFCLQMNSSVSEALGEVRHLEHLRNRIFGSLREEDFYQLLLSVKPVISQYDAEG